MYQVRLSLGFHSSQLCLELGELQFTQTAATFLRPEPAFRKEDAAQSVFAGALAEGGGRATGTGLLCGPPLVGQFSASESSRFASANAKLRPQQQEEEERATVALLSHHRGLKSGVGCERRGEPVRQGQPLAGTPPGEAQAPHEHVFL